MSFTQHCKPNTTYLATYLFNTIYKDYRKKTIIFYRPGKNNNNKYLTSIDNLNQFWNDNVGEWEALQFQAGCLHYAFPLRAQRIIQKTVKASEG